MDLNEIKTPKHCDIDLENWKEYLEKYNITTNSRWLSTDSKLPLFGNFYIPKREFLPKPDSEHHGIWIAEIPYQMITRFTKKNDIIWSIFGGSGVDYEVSNILNRKCIINDLYPKRDFIVKADSTNFNPGTKVKMILAHPPYFDIVKYTNEETDGSNQSDLLSFCKWWIKILDNCLQYLEKDGYFILACGNIYRNSEEISLGNILKDICLLNGLILKQHIIKDYGETKGAEAKNYNVNYYRQLKGGYGNFYGDNIYVLKKTKSKNNIKELYNELFVDKKKGLF